MEKMDLDFEKGGAQFRPKLFPQILTSIIASIGAFGLGSVLGWSSPGIPSIEETGILGPISQAEESWIGSLLPVGAMVTGAFVSFSMEKIGRKNTILLYQCPFLIGWLLIIGASFTSSMALVLCGRFLTGFSGGAMTLIVPVYIGEVVQDKIRGTMSGLMSVALVCGILFSYIVGSVLTWVGLSVACALIPLAATSIIFFPDTPFSLLARGKEFDAQKALVWFRGANEFKEVELEFNQIQTSLSESSQKSGGSFKDLLVPSVLKPVGIALAIMFFQQFAGINAVLFYAVKIFQEAGSDLNPNVCGIIVGGVQVVITAVGVMLVDRLGRKLLLIISEIASAVCLFVLGLYFYLRATNFESVAYLGWLPLISLILYIVSFGIGLMALPWVLLSELSPSHVKGLVCGIGNTFVWGLAFLVTRTFADLVVLLTPAGCYWLFAGTSAIGALFAIFVVPETKGKSFDEINALFR